MSLVVTLPWPHKDLNPNARVHPMSLHSRKKEAKETAMWATKAAIGRATFPHDGQSDILLKQVAHPPDKRDRDRDNIDAALKAARDGLAMALGVNDKFLRPTGIEWGEPVSGGRVVITIGGEA